MRPPVELTVTYMTTTLFEVSLKLCSPFDRLGVWQRRSEVLLYSRVERSRNLWIHFTEVADQTDLC